MSNAHYVGSTTRPDVRADGGQPRVREQAREALALITFSAVTASGLALALMLLTTLGRQG